MNLLIPFLLVAFFAGTPARAEFVRGEFNSWDTSAPMTQDASFGGVWKAAMVAGASDASSEFKFDRFGDWFENWGAGASAAVNSSIGSLAPSGGNLSFSQTSGRRYTFQMASDHGSFVVMETDADPIAIQSVSDAHASVGTGPVPVTIRLSGTRSAQESVYVRYATNITFPASGFALASGSGTQLTANIPGFPVGTRVYYYALSSTMPTQHLALQPDLCTLRGKSAGATNFSYQVLAGGTTGTVPTAEFTETNASVWGSFSTVDFAPTSVSNDATRVKMGTSSIRFTTQSGFPTGVRYPSVATQHWDVTSFTHLEFWIYADNTNQFGFQDAQPVVRLKSAGGEIVYTPNGTLMSNNAWRRYRVPLAGDATWTRTLVGSPSLLDVTQIEIQHDTWDSGFTLHFDGMRFVALVPGSLPPAGPPPPPGVNPDAIEPKVLLFIYDPIVESMGSQRMHVAYGWTDPTWLAQHMASDLRSNSHDLVRYRIVETNIVDDYPVFQDGYKYDDASFWTTWTSRVEHPSMFDYARFVITNGIAPRIERGEIDEVWIYAMPFGGMWESTMAGDGGYWCNSSPVIGVPSTRLFVIMGLNYERGVAEAIHSYGHRAESIMVHSYGTWHPNTNNAWNMFTLYDQQAAGQGHVGNIHFPVNATADYEYASTKLVSSYHQRWTNYPTLGTSVPVTVNVFTWSPTLADPQRDYLNWWYRHLPHVSGRGPDGFLNNWWRYIADPDQFKSWDGNLNLTEGIPQVRVLTLTNGAQVCGFVPVEVEATVDGALGRVDLYVDDAYHSSDTLSPYTFRWDVTGLAGPHTLAAKAVELQNGTESTSAVVTIQIQPMGVTALSNAVGGATVAWTSCPGWTSVVQKASVPGGPWTNDAATLSVATTGSFVHAKTLPVDVSATSAFFRILLSSP